MSAISDMGALRTIVGVLMIVVFLTTAGAVVCLASGQPMVHDCEGSAGASAVLCSFMTIGISSVPTTWAELTAITLLFIISLAVVVLWRMFNGTALYGIPIRNLVPLCTDVARLPQAFLNVVIRDISAGILHSRAFVR